MIRSEKRIFTAVLAGVWLSAAARTQGTGPWKEEQLCSVDALAGRVRKADTSGIYILNTGPMEDILYAIHIGPVENRKYVDRLAALLPGLDKRREVIIYCGCCPLKVCPNLSPAYELLYRSGFKVKVLALEQGLEEDWLAKKYPLQ